MPAHIFLQLGLWHGCRGRGPRGVRRVRCVDRAQGAAAGDAQLSRAAWLQYELLQLGRYREARATIDELAPVVKATGSVTLLSDLSSMRARYVIETASWPLLATESNFGNANELFAIGMSAARSRNRDVRDRARAGAGPSARRIRAKAICGRRSRSWSGRSPRSSHSARARSTRPSRCFARPREREAQLPAPLGLPAPIKPAPELLGEVLVELGRPARGDSLFRAALQRHANRSLSVLGLARATAAAGQAEASRRHYRALLANYSGRRCGCQNTRTLVSRITLRDWGSYGD